MRVVRAAALALFFAAMLPPSATPLSRQHPCCSDPISAGLSPRRQLISEAGATAALAGAARRHPPSMGRRLDLDEIWSVAAAAARDKLAADGGPARPLPERCPFAVEDLVQRPPDLDALPARLAAA